MTAPLKSIGLPTRAECASLASTWITPARASADAEVLSTLSSSVLRGESALSDLLDAIHAIEVGFGFGPGLPKAGAVVLSNTGPIDNDRPFDAPLVDNMAGIMAARLQMLIDAEGLRSSEQHHEGKR